jgi:Ribosomal protein L23
MKITPTQSRTTSSSKNSNGQANTKNSTGVKNIHIKRDTVLVRPRVTEKAALSADKSGVYVFEVTTDATKAAVIASVRDAYKVTPVNVHLVAIPRKKTFVRGRAGSKGGGKKAYVQLAKGDKIEII